MTEALKDIFNKEFFDSDRFTNDLKLIKDFFKGWNAFEITFLIFALTAPLGLGLIFDSSWIYIVAGSSGLVVLLLFGRIL